MTADLLIYIIIAAGLVFWLKSILGDTDDEDDQKREDVFKARENQQKDRTYLCRATCFLTIKPRRII